MPSSLSPARNEWALTWVATGLAALHLLAVIGAGTFRVEHVMADVLLAALAWAGGPARKFLVAGLPLWLTGVMLDSQWLWLGLRGTIHTGDLFALDAAVFPAHVDGEVVPWAAFFWRHPHHVLDVVTGLAYATYLVEFFGLVFALFLMRDHRFSRMAWAFFTVNALGCLVYVLFPAAPPWYVLSHGPGPAELSALPQAAGAARFDALFGIEFFKNFYARNPNVFGAMPSLHAAYPVVALWHVWHLGARWRMGAAAYAALLAFSAVYLSHHYVLDVLAGITTALVASALVHVLSKVGARPARGAAVA